MDRYTVGKTKSLSPLSYEEIDADIVCDAGRVFLEKQDEEGKNYKTLIEKDPAFYQLLTKDKLLTQVEPRQYFLYISSQCNLNCPLCYEDVDINKELSLDEIKDLIKDLKNKSITLMGREPTCREDLFDIIREVSKNNRVNLLTNGIKLTDYEYTKKLKEAGLDLITFSFNGFDDEIYKQINGKPLLDTKLKALETIRKVGIKTCLSLTIAKGINDNQIRDICDFCIDNSSFIYQLRIRTSTVIGRHLEDVETHCLSDIVKLIADQLEIPMEDILREHEFWSLFVDKLEMIVPRRIDIRKLLMRRVCSINFTVRRDEETRSYFSLGRSINMDVLSKAKFQRPLLAYYLVKAFGVKSISQNLLNILKIPVPTGKSSSLMLILRSWPDVYNIDLIENNKCMSQYYKEGTYKPFCYSNIMSNKPTNSNHK